jgi:hypothetical protein
MKWRLIIALSSFGLAMAIATVALIPSAIEPLLWLMIFVICAYLIARRAPGKFFLHGVFVSLVNSVWITASHLLFFDTYIANHAQEAAMSASMPLGTHPRILMAIVGPLIGLASGLILGTFCVIVAKLTGSNRAYSAKTL